MAEKSENVMTWPSSPVPTPSYSFNITRSNLSYIDLEDDDWLLKDQEDVELRRQRQLLYLYCIPPMLFFCFATVVVNAVIVASVRWIRRPLSPTLSFSVSLALADAYASLVLGIGLIINSLLPVGLNIKRGPNDGCYALTLEAFRLGGIIVTVGHLTALAINHYIGILRPLHYASTMTPRTTLVCIALLWIVPILTFFTYFSIIEDQGFRSEACSNFHFLTQKRFRRTFSSLFFGPLVLMAIIYIHIFIIVRRHQASRLRFQNSQQLARSVKAIKTTVLILGTCVVGWMPAVLVYSLVCADCSLTFTTADPVTMSSIYTICNLLIILKTFVDPVIYAARMHEIKMALKRMRMYCCRCCPAFISGAGDQPIVNSEMSHHRLSHYASRNRRQSVGSGTGPDTSVFRFQSLRNNNGSVRNHVVITVSPPAGGNGVNDHPAGGLHHHQRLRGNWSSRQRDKEMEVHNSTLI